MVRLLQLARYLQQLAAVAVAVLELQQVKMAVPQVAVVEPLMRAAQEHLAKETMAVLPLQGVKALLVEQVAAAAEKVLLAVLLYTQPVKVEVEMAALVLHLALLGLVLHTLAAAAAQVISLLLLLTV
jgi:hypothetical protein